MMNCAERYLARVYAIMTERLFGIVSNYSTGWTTGDCDFY